MKKLICAKEVEEFAKGNDKCFYIEAGTIITPSAKDAAKNAGIEFVEGSCNSCSGSKPEFAPANGGIDSNLIYNALQAMMKQGKLDVLMGMFMQDQKYLSEKDPNGFKLVKGSTVKLEVLDTGNPADEGKVFYQELINGDDKSPMNAGFLTIENTCFDWDVLVHELYYVVEGTIEITINGKVYTGKAGDSLYFPKGTKVNFGSPNKVKVFYATY